MVSIPIGVGGKKVNTYLGLVDSGASGSLADKELISSCSRKKITTKSTTWQTKTGTFTTEKSVLLENVRLPQFTTKRRVDAEFHLFSKSPKEKYDFILGRDFLQHVGLDILNSKQVFAWGGIEVDMLPRGH